VLDAEGLPWDQRIHASSKTRNADGTWRQRRGVDPSLVEHVRAELKQTMSAPAPAAPPPPVAPVAPPPPVAPVAPPPPVAPVAPPPPPLQVDNYMSLLTRLSADKASGVVTNVQIDTALEQLGVPTLAALIARPDLVPTLEGMIYDND
jgi:outer membrane biosynthesis protein TonB